MMDKEQLLAPRAGTAHGMPEDTVILPGGVGAVRVRGLSRREGIRVQRAGGLDETDEIMLSLGMVDPIMTVEDVRRWSQVATAGEIEIVSRRIAELSALTDTAPKEAYKSA